MLAYSPPLLTSLAQFVAPAQALSWVAGWLISPDGTAEAVQTVQYAGALGVGVWVYGFLNARS